MVLGNPWKGHLAPKEGYDWQVENHCSSSIHFGQICNIKMHKNDKMRSINHFHK